MRIITRMVSVAMLCALAAAVQAKSPGSKTVLPTLKDDADVYCGSCKDGQSPDNRPIRGSNEVKLCEDGYYCNCIEGTKVQCPGVFGIHGKFNPDNPDALTCSMTHNCQKWFDEHPDPVVTTASPGTPATPPTPTTPPTPPTVQTPTTPAPPCTPPTPATPATPATPRTPATTPSPSSTSPSPPSPPSACVPTQCPSKVAELMLPDPADCNRYIRCYYGRAWNMPCAPGTWFSFLRQGCVYRSQSECVQN